MTVPVWVEQQNGTFTASVLGKPEMKAAGATRDEAVAALRVELQQRLANGELVYLDVEPPGLQALAGRYKDDPVWKAVWDDIVTEAYRYRDELKAQEFPE